MKYEIKYLQNIIEELIKNGEDPKEICVTFGYDIIDKIINLQKEIEQLKEERKTLYKYTPEKGFELVGMKNE